MKIDLRKEIELPEGVTVNLETNSLVKLKGPKGEIERSFHHPKIKILVEGKTIVLTSLQATKREKTIIGSYESHIKNMVQGVQEGFVYKLKICSGHFPMNVNVSGDSIIIKNFLGESVPRKAKLIPTVEVKVNGEEIVVSGLDKELTGQMAARIERMCRITNRDLRIFQDGCYITHKAGKIL
jgi:large subunit ribosomal protein L6